MINTDMTLPIANPDNGGSKHLWNVGQFLADVMLSSVQEDKPSSSLQFYLLLWREMEVE
jgi:hypothetical protein